MIASLLDIRFILDLMTIPAGVAIVLWALLARWNSILTNSIKRDIAISVGLLFLLPVLALPVSSNNEMASLHAEILGSSASVLAVVLGHVAVRYTEKHDILGHALMVFGSLEVVVSVVGFVIRIPR